MNIPLREGDFNAALLQRVPDVVTEIAGNAQPRDWLLSPGQEHKVETAVAKIKKANPRRRISQQQRMVGRRQQRLLHLAGIGVVANADLYPHPHPRIAAGKVNHLIVEEAAVGHDQLHIIQVANAGAAYADMLHGAKGVANLYHIARNHGALQQQDKTADEVANKLLETKADADRQATGNNGKSGQGDTHNPQGQQKANQQQGIGGHESQNLIKRGVYTGTRQD